MTAMYEPLETSKCEKCGKTIAEPRELIRIGSMELSFIMVKYLLVTF